MTGRVQRVWLNGTEFASVHPALLLQHINEGDTKLTQKWMDRPGCGQILTGHAPQRREIHIEFAIRDGRDYARRVEAFSAACAWAYAGGWLELSDRPGQKIYVKLSQLPTLGRLREWTETMTIDFVAGWYPFFENKEPSTGSVTNVSQGSLSMFVPGNVQSCLGATVVSSSALSSIRLGVQETGTEILIAPSPSITAGAEIKLFYTNQHLLCITAGGTDLIRWRTGSDDLLVNPGANTINYQFDAASDLQLIAGGAWL